MNQQNFYVLWEHQNHNYEWSQMRTSFSIKSSTIQYARWLKEHYTNVREVEVAATIPLTEDKPMCPTCKTDDAMVFHENEQKWFCHHTHTL